MSRLSFHELSFRYEQNPEPVFTGFTAAVDPAARVGVVGGNGTGKSTLFRLLSGELSPTAGDIVRAPGLAIGFLRQEAPADPEESVAACLFAADPALRSARIALERSRRGETAPPHADDAEIAYAALSGYEREAEASAALARVGLRAKTLERPNGELSGGERTRAGLARLLLSGANLLLLDEPTNHLDPAALDWLAEFLTGCGIPFLAASHDRDFLDACCDRIWEIDRGALRISPGGYGDLKARRETERRTAEIRHEAACKKIRRLTNALHDRREWALSYQRQTGPGGNAPVFESVMNDARRAMKRAKAVERRLERMVEEAEAGKPFLEKGRRLELAASGGRVPVALAACGLAFSRGARRILRDLSLTLRPGERVALVGVNGAGKTTLLRLLAGRLAADAGEIRIPGGAPPAFLDQDDADLPAGRTLLAAVADGTPAGEERARTILGRLGLRGDLPLRPVEAASPGERRKAALAAAVLSGASLLLFDEPTNHLEIASREALEEAFRAFPGAILFACHDRAFLRAVATDRFALPEGRRIGME